MHRFINQYIFVPFIGVSITSISLAVFISLPTNKYTFNKHKTTNTPKL